MKTALLLVGHGSKHPSFDEPLRQVLLDLRDSKLFDAVQDCYLEINDPSIEKAIDDCVQSHCARVILVPYFVLKGNHVVRDIPEIVERAQKKYQNQCVIELKPYLGYDKTLSELVIKRARQL